MRSNQTIFYRKKKLFVIALIFLCSLCGCTRKEELVLLTGEEREQTGAVSMSDGTAEERREAADGESAAGGNVRENADGQAAEDTGRGEAAASGQITAESAGWESAGTGMTEEMRASAAGAAEETVIYVHVCGAVGSPGVYELAAGSRVYEAVREAGGFAENADESYVNQAQTLTDGDKLMIPTVEEVALAARGEGNAGMQMGIVEQKSAAGTGESAGSGAGQTQAAAEDGRININTASAEELCRIPGIGATRAAAVLSYRETHGSFKSPEDIMNVSGIKEGTYDKIKDSIRVD